MVECGGLAFRLLDVVGWSRGLDGGQEAGTVFVEGEESGWPDLEKQDSEDQKEVHQARKSKMERWEVGS